MKAIICLIGDYIKYLTYINDLPIFNTNTFIANRDDKEKGFYQDLVSTQLFQQFIEDNCKETYPYFFKLLLRYNQSINDCNKKKKKFDSVKSLFSGKRSTSAHIKDINSNKSNLDNSITNKSKNIENINTLNIINNSKNSVNDMNSNSGSKGNISPKEKGGDFSEGYIIIPFFIEEELIKSDFLKLDIHLREKYKSKYREYNSLRNKL